MVFGVSLAIKKLLLIILLLSVVVLKNKNATNQASFVFHTVCRQVVTKGLYKCTGNV